MREPEPDRLNVALLLDGPALDAWAKDAVERMIEETEVDISHLVVNTEGREHERGLLGSVRDLFDSIVEYGPWAPVEGFYSKIDPPSYLRSHDITSAEWAADATWIECEPAPYEGLGHSFPADVIDALRGEVDVIIRIGFGIVQGEILTVAEHGVLSFHHGDVRKYRGRPAGVWEFLNDEKTAGITLQRLTPTLDGGEIVVFEEVPIEDAETWQEVHRRLLVGSREMLAQGIRNLQDAEFEPETPDELGDLYFLPGWKSTLRIVLKNVL